MPWPSADLPAVCTEADSQRASEAQVHHTIHQEDGLSDRADRPLPPLEVRGARGGIQLRRLRHVRPGNKHSYAHFPKVSFTASLIYFKAAHLAHFSSRLLSGMLMAMWTPAPCGPSLQSDQHR